MEIDFADYVKSLEDRFGTVIIALMPPGQASPLPPRCFRCEVEIWRKNAEVEGRTVDYMREEANNRWVHIPEWPSPPKPIKCRYCGAESQRVVGFRGTW